MRPLSFLVLLGISSLPFGHAQDQSDAASLASTANEESDASQTPSSDSESTPSTSIQDGPAPSATAPGATSSPTVVSSSDTGSFAPNLFFNWTFDPVAGWIHVAPDVRESIKDAGPETSWMYDFQSTENVSLGTENTNYPVGSGHVSAFGRIEVLRRFASFFQGKAIYMSGTSTNVTDDFFRGMELVTVSLNNDSNTALQLLSGGKRTAISHTNGSWELAADMGRFWGPYTSYSTFQTQEIVRGDILTVDRLTYTLGIQTDAETIDDVPVSVEYAILSDYSVNPIFSFQGNWTLENNLPPLYPYMKGCCDNVTVDIPANTSLLLVNGTVGPEFGSFVADFEPRAPGYFPTPFLAQMAPTTYNPTYAPAPLVMQTLDPKVKYTMTLASNTSSWRPGLPSFGMGVHSVTFFSGASVNNTNNTNNTSDTNNASNTGDSSTNNEPTDAASNNTKNKSAVPVGAIAGGVVGGVAGAALIIGAIWLCCARRRAKPRPTSVDRVVSGFTIDDDDEEVLDPSSAAYENKAQGSLGGYSGHRTATTRTSSSGGYTLPPHPSTDDGSSSAEAPTTAVGRPAPRAADAAPSKRPRTMRERATRMMPRPPRAHRFQQEEDGGSVAPEGEIVELIPPTYNPAWLNNRAAAGASTPAGNTESGPSGTGGTTRP